MHVKFFAIAFLLLALVPIVAFSAEVEPLAVTATEVTVGDGTGSNLAPFGNLVPDTIYQQVYSGASFPPASKLQITSIAFKSNQAISPGVTKVNMVMKIGTAQAITNSPTMNAGPDLRTVFAGWVATNDEGLLIPDLKKQKPFFFSSLTEAVLVQVEVLESQGPGGFMFGPSPLMWRVYALADGATPPNYELNSAGITTVFSVKVFK